MYMNAVATYKLAGILRFERGRLEIDELPFSRARSLKSKLLGVGRHLQQPQSQFHSLLHSNLNMSFAGRRRGNKVKKGVQFTVMVVGTSLRRI